MPYIMQVDRKALDKGRSNASPPLDAGELNYIVSAEVTRYLSGDVSYAKINEVIGVLECAKLELYRRIAVPYEDMKIEQNGDVYQ